MISPACLKPLIRWAGTGGHPYICEMDNGQRVGNSPTYRLLSEGLMGSSCCNSVLNKPLGIQYQWRSTSLGDLVNEKVKNLWEVDVWLNVTSDWTSLVAQWLRICLPMQGTRVWALVWEDPTCCGATKPVRHNYWACALEPASHNYWAHVPQLLKLTRLYIACAPQVQKEKPPQWEVRTLQRRVAPARCN